MYMYIKMYLPETMLGQKRVKNKKFIFTPMTNMNIFVTPVTNTNEFVTHMTNTKVFFHTY